MDCPNCGVYNPDERRVCWRCDKELPKPEEPKKRRADGAAVMRRMWLIVAVAIVAWLLLTWRIPMLLGGVPTPSP